MRHAYGAQRRLLQVRKLRQHFGLQLSSFFYRRIYMKTNEKTLRHVLDLARAEINQQRPQRALEHLRTIREQIDELRKTPLWAEFQITYAEALGAMCLDAAEHEFQEAFLRLSELSPREPILELR